MSEDGGGGLGTHMTCNSSVRFLAQRWTHRPGACRVAKAGTGMRVHWQWAVQGGAGEGEVCARVHSNGLRT